MKASLITIILCYVIVFLLGSQIGDFLFPWGGVAESYLKPIYLGIILLSGLIVGCTVYLPGLIKENKNNES